MTQQVYRLELTELEKEDAIFAFEKEVVAFESLELSGAYAIAHRYQELADKLRALEPVGTEGES